MVKPKLDLKALRDRHGLTQAGLACKLGFSRSHIATVEARGTGVSTRMMHEIIKKRQLRGKKRHLLQMPYTTLTPRYPDTAQQQFPSKIPLMSL